MNLQCYEWAAERAIEQEGGIDQAIELYKRLSDEVKASDPVPFSILQSYRKVLDVLESRKRALA